MGLLCNEKAENLLDSTTTELPKYPSSSSSSTRKTHQQNLQKDSEHLDCPRCGSKNTKFCYYNNYNKSQPRHFCKACKRHWTKGGSLRNVPVGGCRKNKRLKTTSSSDKSPSITTAVSVAPSSSTSVNLMYHQDCHDLYFGDQQGLKEITEDNQKNISSLVFDAIMDNSSRSFSFSGIDSLTLDGGSSIQSSISGIQDKNNVYYYYYDHCSNNSQLESLESSSTITTVTQSNNFFYPTWNSDGTAAAAEMVDCWNLNDLDALISTDINVPWDDDDDHKSLII